MKIFGKISREIKCKSQIRQHQTQTIYIFPAVAIDFYYIAHQKVKIHDAASDNTI